MVFRRIALLIASFTVVSAMHAQALPSATGGSLSIQAGAGVSIASPDYTDPKIKGVSAFGNVDLPMGLGVAVEYHDLNIWTPHDIAESSFLGGLRFGKAKGSFYPYVKALAGAGTFTFQKGYYYYPSSASYGIYAIGGGLEYRTRKHLMVRIIDLEYQDWHSFQPNGLTPYILTFGAGYRFHASTY